MIVNVEGEVIEIKKSEPVFFGNGRMTAVRVELVGNPNIEYNVECDPRIGEIFRHDIFQTNQRQD